MKLEILSMQEALDYVPLEKSGAIRIFGSRYKFSQTNGLIENDNWIYVDKCFFDDGFPSDYQEFEGRGIGKEEIMKLNDDYFRATMGRKRTLFSEKDAKQILDNYEKIENKIENLIIHCTHGANRSPAIGMAMNDFYGWGIEGLKEKFPMYRRYVYDVMMKEASKR